MLLNTDTKFFKNAYLKVKYQYLIFRPIGRKHAQRQIGIETMLRLVLDQY